MSGIPLPTNFNVKVNQVIDNRCAGLSTGINGTNSITYPAHGLLRYEIDTGKWKYYDNTNTWVNFSTGVTYTGESGVTINPNTNVISIGQSVDETDDVTFNSAYLASSLHVNGLTFISNPTVPTVGNDITNFKIDGSYDGMSSSFQIQMGRGNGAGQYGAARATLKMVGGGLQGMTIGDLAGPNAYLAIKAARQIEYRTPGGFSWSGHYFHGVVFNFNSSPISSDDRLKWEEEDITNGLEVINKLKPQIYWKGKELNVEPNTEERTRESGYIAQEVEEIPELTHIVKQSANKDMSPGTYFLDYAQIHPYHTSAIQELHKLVKTLQARIAILEGR